MWGQTIHEIKVALVKAGGESWASGRAAYELENDRPTIIHHPHFSHNCTTQNGAEG